MIDPAPFTLKLSQERYIGIQSPYPLWEMVILDQVALRVLGKSSDSPIPNQDALMNKLAASKQIVGLEFHDNIVWISHHPGIDVCALQDHAVRILKEHFALRITQGR